MKKAYIFPGQGAQFTGMGLSLFQNSPKAKILFEQANEIVGFNLSEIMFEGSAEDLKQTKVTQPAVFLHSVALALSKDDFAPDMVAGHSLGEISALVAIRSLSFEDGLQLVAKRSQAMQHACELNSSTMAAILNLPDETVEEICHNTEGIVVAANYNCPGQLVISGENEAIEKACEKAKEAGAKRALILPVGGAFHSPLMQPAQDELQKAIDSVSFKKPICPIYQNVSTVGETDVEIIHANLAKQLTAPVKWTQSIAHMIADGASYFIELGPGKALQGMIKKINGEVKVESFAE